MINLQGTPYAIDGRMEQSLRQILRDLEDRIAALRAKGRLSEKTLRHYYGEKRFEQVAESNAIEGSTLTIGETELAVLKGVTISGKDPSFSNDARNLDKALAQLNELAKDKSPTDLEQVKLINRLVREGYPTAGEFREEEVRITGSRHRPPKTWGEIDEGMRIWQTWSQEQTGTSPLLRSAVLHAWLTHIHPFIDGNGRTARAVGNLELIRAGYPPIIIKRIKHRDRYIEALQESDAGGNLALFLELLTERQEDALADLEKAAQKGQGYDKALEQIRRRQEGRLAVWNAAMELLTTRVDTELREVLDGISGKAKLSRYRDSLSLDDYIKLCGKIAVTGTWEFKIECSVPGLPPVHRLAWTGFRSHEMESSLPAGSADGPSLFWSERNLEAYPPWKQVTAHAPGGEEMTLVDDTWYVRQGDAMHKKNPGELAKSIVGDLLHSFR